MEKFTVVVDYNPEVEFHYSDLTQNFSENFHKATAESGINPIIQKWSVKVSGTIPKVKSAHDFIVNHLGTSRFQWTTPHGEPIYVRCFDAGITCDTPLTANLNLVFEQVYQP